MRINKNYKQQHKFASYREYPANVTVVLMPGPSPSSSFRNINFFDFLFSYFLYPEDKQRIFLLRKSSPRCHFFRHFHFSAIFKRRWREEAKTWKIFVNILWNAIFTTSDSEGRIYECKSKYFLRRTRDYVHMCTKERAESIKLKKCKEWTPKQVFWVEKFLRMQRVGRISCGNFSWARWSIYVSNKSQH